MAAVNRARGIRQSGQALTEALITASFVLVPLLLLVALLGKYIDLRHATVQAARYEAWEYTVWYGDEGERPRGFAGAQPVKAPALTQLESRRRFFSRTDLVLDSDDDLDGWTPADRRPLWTYHTGEPFFDDSVPIPNNSAPHTAEPTPDLTGGVMNFLGELIDTAFGAMSSLIGLVGSVTGSGGSTADFDVINTDGLATATVSATITVPPGIVDVRTLHGDSAREAGLGGNNLTFGAGAAVLTDAWNAGGVKHVQDRAGGVVPSRLMGDLLDTIPGLNGVLSVIGLLVPELSPCDPLIANPVADPEGDGTLWLGYMNVDAVPTDRLSGGGSVQCPEGICAWDPPVSRSPCGGLP